MGAPYKALLQALLNAINQLLSSAVGLGPSRWVAVGCSRGEIRMISRIYPFGGLDEKPWDTAVSLRKAGMRHSGSRRSTHIHVYLKTPERPPGLAGAPECQSARGHSPCRGCGSETG